MFSEINEDTLLKSVLDESEIEMSEQVKASAWHDQLLPILTAILPQILEVISRMIGTQISVETKKMHDEVAVMQANMSKSLDEHLQKQKAEMEKLQKRQEQILQDLDMKIQQKTAALGVISGILQKAGEALNQVPK